MITLASLQMAGTCNMSRLLVVLAISNNEPTNRTPRNDRRTQGCLGRRSIAGPSCPPLSRSTRGHTSPSAVANARPIPSRNDSKHRGRAAEGRPIEVAPSRAGTHRSRARARQGMDETVDLTALENDFVKAAGPYSQRRGISYAAWRDLGVPAVSQAGGHRPRRLNPAGQRRRPRRAAIVGRARHAQSSSDRSSGTPSVEPSNAWQARSGWGIRPDDVSSRIADTGDVVDRSVGIVDVAEDDPVVGPKLGQGFWLSRCSCPRSD